MFQNKLDFKDIKLSVKIGDILKIQEKELCCISVFDYENKERYQIYVSKNTLKRYVDLLLIREEDKRYYVVVKDFNTFMYVHTLHRERKHFCRCCLQAFSTEEILKFHTKYCFKLMVNKGLTCLKRWMY